MAIIFTIECSILLQGNCRSPRSSQLLWYGSQCKGVCNRTTKDTDWWKTQRISGKSLLCCIIIFSFYPVTSLPFFLPPSLFPSLYISSFLFLSSTFLFPFLFYVLFLFIWLCFEIDNKKSLFLYCSFL